MAIILTPAFITNASVNADHPRIGYHNLLRTLSLDADDLNPSTEDSTGPADNILNPNDWQYWLATALSATLVIDFGSNQTFDYVGIAGHTIGTEGNTLTVEHSTDNVSYTTFASATAPSTDAPILFLDSQVTARYVRLTLEGSGSPAKIAVVYVGTVLAVEQGIYVGHAPSNLNRKTKLTAAMSDGGKFLGQLIVRKGVQTSVELTHLTPGWIRDTFDAFVQSARQYPYFFAWKPASYPLEVIYGWTQEDIRPQNSGPRGLMSVSFPIQGVGYAD